MLSSKVTDLVYLQKSMPPGVVAETSLAPRVAAGWMEMLEGIWLELSMVKLLTVITEPKPTAEAPVKSMPVMVTSSVSP